MKWCLFNGRIFCFMYTTTCILYKEMCILNKKLGRNMTDVRSLGKLSGSPPVASDPAIATGVLSLLISGECLISFVSGQ